MSKFRIYLAGPDVFFPHAQESYSQLESFCQQLDLEGVRPADGTDTYRGAMGTPEHGTAIYLENIERIRSCHAVLANLQPFRNAVEPDSGTVFEVGFAVALGLPVAGVLPELELTLEDKVLKHFGKGEIRNGLGYDKTHDCLIETFGFSLNLMLACSTNLYSHPTPALQALRERIQAAQ